MSRLSRLLKTCTLSALLVSTLTVNAPPSHAAPAAPVQITPLNASAVASSAITSGDVQVIIPRAASGAPSGMGNGRLLPAINDESPNTTALGLALEVALYGPGKWDSPIGGFVEITKGQHGKLKGHFVGLKTLYGFVNGDLDLYVTSGNIVSGTYTAEVTCKDIVLNGGAHTCRLKGPAKLSVSGDASNFHVTFTSNITYVTPRGSLTNRDLRADTRISLKGSDVTASTTLEGAVEANDVNGLNGSIQVATRKPLELAGTLSERRAGVLSLRSGEIALNEALTLSVVKPNIVAAALNGKTTRRFAWEYLGGQRNASFDLRPAYADTIFHNGTVLTVDAKDSRAKALAVLDGHILAVGQNFAVFPFQAPTTRMVDLRGKTIMPGFVEPHAHTSLSALNLLADVTPRVVPCGTEAPGNTIEKVLADLRAAVKKAPKAKAFFGFNFDPSRLVKKELMQNLTREQLDGVSATIPIVVQNASQHVSYVNSAAFRATGLWPTAPKGPFTAPDKSSPMYGFLVVDAKTGLPTGVLNDFAQEPFLKLAVGAITETKADKLAFAKKWREFQDVLARVGVTSYGEMLLGAFAGTELESELLGLISLDPTNPCRIRAYIDTQSFTPDKLNMFPGEGYDRLKIIGGKFISDGSTQGLTAGLSFPYKYPGPYPAAANGETVFKSADDFYTRALPWYRAGWQLAVHANGDRALDYVLSGFDKLQKTMKNRNARFRVEHFTVHTPAEVARQVAAAKLLDVNVGLTIGHVYFWGQVFHDTLLGEENSRYLLPLKTLVDAGVRVSTHSDSPVTSPNPLRNVYIATNRLWQMEPRKVLSPNQVITVPQALRTITTNPAYAMFLDKEVGSLEVGKLADLVVLSADPTTTKPADMMGVHVVGTWLAGHQVSGGKL